MLDFDHYLCRHGEIWILHIVEEIERHQGLRHNSEASLEERWNALMHTPVDLLSPAA